MQDVQPKEKRIFFIEMMGEPGSYDASVYDLFEDKDREGVWFIKRFSDVPGITIETCNVCIGDPLPDPDTFDGVVLAGSYNSVHDNTGWQVEIRKWLPRIRGSGTPILAVCGSHQLLSHADGARVARFEDGPYAGTFPVQLTPEGRASILLKSIPQGAGFQFANSDYVLDIPKGATLLASSGKTAVAALDFGDHCYSTQFHPEGTHKTLSTVWQFKAPELMDGYHPEEFGYQVVRNFLELVAEL